MKRILSLLLALLLIASLWGCTRQEDPDKPITFYYSRAEYVYGNEGSVMGAEEREWNGQSDDLKGILTLYLNGPLNETLQSPFPSGTALVEIIVIDRQLIISLNNKLSLLSGIDLTLACACLSKTCFQLTDAEQITIKSPETEAHPAVYVTLSRNSIAFSDTVTQAKTTEPTTP
jgi:hypothetical protein